MGSSAAAVRLARPVVTVMREDMVDCAPRWALINKGVKSAHGAQPSRLATSTRTDGVMLMTLRANGVPRAAR